ncbi:hypothetical protein D3C87_2008780 [compost metagenome]
MYIILPSKLNEYPKGKINDTTLLLQPNLSNSSTNLGKTASELVVEKAISKGDLILFNRSKRRFPKIKYPTINKTSQRTAIAKKKSLR